MTNVHSLPIWHFDQWKNCSTLPEHSCAIYRIDLSTPPLELASAWCLLNPEEQRRAQGFKLPIHHDRYVQSHAVLRMILAHHTKINASQIEFTINRYGKPSLMYSDAKSPINFNLSHSHELAVVAVSIDKKVGIDIEFVNEQIDFENIAKHSFTVHECEYLFNQPLNRQRAAFFQLWAYKESFVKAIGKGFSLPLNQFKLELTDDLLAHLDEQSYESNDNYRWSMGRLPCDANYAAALTIGEQ